MEPLKLGKGFIEIPIASKKKTFHVNEHICPDEARIFPSQVRVSKQGTVRIMNLHFISLDADAANTVREEMIADGWDTFSSQRGTIHALYLWRQDET
jgi:hypothetical protein